MINVSIIGAVRFFTSSCCPCAIIQQIKQPVDTFICTSEIAGLFIPFIHPVPLMLCGWPMCCRAMFSLADVFNELLILQ